VTSTGIDIVAKSVLGDKTRTYFIFLNTCWSLKRTGKWPEMAFVGLCLLLHVKPEKLGHSRDTVNINDSLLHRKRENIKIKLEFKSVF
jgi:hypothetical protein